MHIRRFVRPSPSDEWGSFSDDAAPMACLILSRVSLYGPSNSLCQSPSMTMPDMSTAPDEFEPALSPAALSPADLLYGDFALEYANTRRMLERYPDGKGEWRPHPRSRSLAQLATHVADIIYRGVAVLES